ncbi:flavodoxin [Candidatus Ruminimicrobiellum ovillum]|uniref:flavodoxin n=1 Tax=Candidatus Ruminimicrobiellum ovillum TaxID=1947927 RepID=UPI00355A7DCC
MKIALYIILIAAIIAGVSSLIHLYKVSNRNKTEMAKYSTKVNLNANLGKTLVIYYSLSGNTKDIALQIQSLTNANLYEIKPKEEIKQGPALYLTSKKQISSGNYPEIVNDFPNIEEYDTIFVGSPIWWYTAAPVVLEFLKEFDFQNKNVVPFSTQGSNYGTYFEDFKAKAKNANILKGEAFNNLDSKYNEQVKNKIINWLNGLTTEEQKIG